MQESSNVLEEFRKNPERYMSMMEFDIFEDAKPDLSIMEDNQIIDVIVDKANRDIDSLCDDQNSKV